MFGELCVGLPILTIYTSCDNGRTEKEQLHRYRYMLLKELQDTDTGSLGSNSDIDTGFPRNNSDTDTGSPGRNSDTYTSYPESNSNTGESMKTRPDT